MELLRNSCTKDFSPILQNWIAWPYRLSVCWLKDEQKRLLISTVSLNPILLLHSIPFLLTAFHLTLLIILVHPTSSLNTVRDNTVTSQNHISSNDHITSPSNQQRIHMQQVHPDLVQLCYFVARRNTCSHFLSHS